MRAPIYIQNALDRHFPGVRLDWHPRLQWWVLSDYGYWPDGLPALDAWYPVTGLLRGIELCEWSNRRPFLYWGTIEAGIRAPLSLDSILETLWKFRQVATAAGVNEAMDRLEEREDNAKRLAERKSRELAHDRAKDIWKSNHLTTIGDGIQLTPWKHSRAVDREHAAQEREMTRAQAAELDAEVTRRMRAGAGIAAIRRSVRQEVA